jgi:hypothetical protein
MVLTNTCTSGIVVALALTAVGCGATPTNQIPGVSPEETPSVAGSLFDTTAILRAATLRWRVDSVQAVRAARQRCKEIGEPCEGDPAPFVWVGEPEPLLRAFARLRGQSLLDSPEGSLPACPAQLHHTPRAADTVGFRVTMRLEIVPPDAARLTTTQTCKRSGTLSTEHWTETYELALKAGQWRSAPIRVTVS